MPKIAGGFEDDDLGGLSGYDRHKARARQRQADQSKEGRDIGPLPEVEDPERKASCRLNYERFCQTYLKHSFPLPPSNDHLEASEIIKTVVVDGGTFAYAMPRGSGKTTKAESAVIWAICYGHRQFPLLIGADQGGSIEMLNSVKLELETNELLLADFPEVCYPVRCLEGIPHRANGQLLDGERTRMEWTDDTIVLPTIPNSPASGCIVKASGITGRLRGMKHKRADGRSVRPDLVVIDDPQTDDSARSPLQVSQRMRVINGTILGLAGPGKKIAAVMPCTVIVPGDVADQLLNRDRNPQWRGKRTKLVYKFPTDEKLWDEYRKKREQEFKDGGDGAKATAFYKKNRKAMDAGAKVAWEHRKEPGDLSALQYAMNLKFDRGDDAFGAEYQNEPPIEKTEDNEVLDPTKTAERLNQVPRGVIPASGQHLVAMIDVQKTSLWYTVLSVEDGFSGDVIDYGVWPEQKRSGYYTLRDLKKTLATMWPKKGPEELLYDGLAELTEWLLSREFRREGSGEARKIELCLVDANFMTETIFKFARASRFSNIIRPCHGRFVGASSTPFSQYRPKAGEKSGMNWRIPLAVKRATRHVLFDANFWKTFARARLQTGMGGRGAIRLFGKDPEEHRQLCDHFVSESAHLQEAKGRSVLVWDLKPTRPDNHWWDGLVGCLVAASILGVQIIAPKPSAPKKPRRSIADRQREARHHTPKAA